MAIMANSSQKSGYLAAAQENNFANKLKFYETDRGLKRNSMLLFRVL